MLYEDNHLIAVEKPAGLLTQADTPGGDCLLERVRAYLKKKYAKPGNVFVGLVHRLDKPVAGVVLFARTSKAASRLSEQIRTRAVEKVYQALVEGNPPAGGRLEHYLSGDASERIEASTDAVEGWKRAALSYRRLSARDGRALLEVALETGRKHQIRAQLAALGSPIVGDRKYGARGTWSADGIALVAVRLAFQHPTRPQERITVELPADRNPLREWL